MTGEQPRPAPPPGAVTPPAVVARPAPPPSAPARPAGDPVVPADADRGADRAPGSGHPAVDAALQGIANAAALAPADQIAQYEAAHRILRETLTTIDQS